jgi:hypothetical protein
VAYHGCDESVVTDILVRGETLKASANDYDWLGRGVYFWEHGPDRIFKLPRGTLPPSLAFSSPTLTIWSNDCFLVVDLKTEAKYAAPPRTRKELRALLNASIKRARSMSTEQIFGTLVRAGIYTRHGRLRKEYGG